MKNRQKKFQIILKDLKKLEEEETKKKKQKKGMECSYSRRSQIRCICLYISLYIIKNNTKKNNY